ncbi:hypothetical protein SAMN04487895_11489 [Paenibacillus sophorae]|uniref:Restriction endonuclease n=1 Tax=Paenibacillus sophorae TaxID=1333845 RepID=A0A1H8TJT9_9BACL|nr:hypothetical protein [Paenibacillus sophorae]QWU16248.1 hypothetical protein KP014_02955 [Paenibacillus sophorae]SEO91046.1 hypothetical protein SAMN04487895_11489 [Paenibacillus sophorae]
MSNIQKVLVSLLNAELCDDCLSISANVIPRQTVYKICRSLFSNSEIHRHHGKCDHCHKTKTTNRLPDQSANTTTNVEVQKSPLEAAIRPWYWEGCVQSKVVNHLILNGYSICSVADTEARTSGKDIVAQSIEGKELWISVKGYPEKSQHTQARHWFSGAIFDLILYHGENPNVALGIALPDGFSTFKNLTPRMKWLKDAMPFQIYWVDETGIVKIE